MANPKPRQPKNSKKPPVYSKPAVQKLSLFDNLNNWVDKNFKTLIVIAFACCTLFSLLLFQARMDIGGDDSTYLQRAYDFIHRGIFPSFQGPMYPIIISPFIGLFGINIILLKLLSVVFNFFTLYFMYKAFKNRLPSFILYIVLFLTAVNAYILNFASLTYSESLFMMFQSLMFFYFFRLTDRLENNQDKSLPANYRQWLMLGFLVFLLAGTRTVGLFAFGGFIAYFILRKQYKYILYLACAFFVFQFSFQLLEKVIWHAGSGGGSQTAMFLQKNPYDASEGNETLNGLFVRFKENTVIYLSKRFFQIIGLRSADSTESSDGLTFFFIILYLFCMYRIFKSKNYPMLLISLYTICMICVSCFVLQTRWDQARIVMVYVPMMLLVILYGLYDALKNLWIGRIAIISVIVVLCIAGLKDTLNRSSHNLPILSKNLQGDIFAGFSTDWVNYLKISQWCSNNLPADAYVAARKAPMSFIYANGKEFFPIYTVSTSDPDSVLSFFKKNKVNYVMLASLRMNPNVADGNIINTLWRMLGPIAQKYPQKVKLIHQEGTVEPAYIYQIIN